MEDAFLIEEANRYDIKGKSYIGTPLKYYFMDMGLRNSRIHYRQMEVTHSMENVIYNELRMRGFHVDVGNLTVVEKGKNAKPIKNNWKLILSAVRVLKSTISSQRTCWRRKQK